MKPLAIDLFCGLGGWSEGLLMEGYDVIGFDIERHQYGDDKYPAQLVLQDVLTIHGKQFKDAALIVASPPCQEFSYMAMPWSLAKEKAKRIQADPSEQIRLTALFDACFRIQREAIEAANRYIPLIVENVCGAQKWVGRSRWHYGSFHLWGDIPSLMPFPSGGRKAKGNGSGGWFGDYKKHGERGSVVTSLSWTSSKSPERKRASAMIAKIPLPLARHIAKAYKPINREWRIESVEEVK